MKPHNRLSFSHILLLSMTMQLLLPEIWLAKTHPWYEILVSISINSINYSTIVFSMLLLGSILDKTFGKATKRVFIITMFLFISIYSISQSFLWYYFHRHWDHFTLQLFKETTLRESTEFIGTYILRAESFALITVYVLLDVISFKWSYKHKENFLPAKTWHRVILFLAVCSVFSQSYFLIASNAKELYDKAAGQPIKRTAIFNIRASLLQMKEYEHENEKCIETLNKYSYRDEIPDGIEYVILIIGESYNRHHSSLYGYPLETSPCMKKRALAPGFHVFKDVVAPANLTSTCYKLFLSTASCNDTTEWCDVPLFPAIFKHQGWNVVYYSNQFVCEENLDQWDAPMGFVNHPSIAKHIFSTRNHKTYDYDMQLVEDYITHRKELEKQKNLIIFHLYGQHVEYSSRYTHDFDEFNQSDIKRNNLSEYQKTTIAQYDNATRYNDFVVDRIMGLFDNRNAVIIYFADHGEEIYDFRNQQGRTDLETDVRQAIHHQLDVPFVVNLTEKCRQKHPEWDNLLKCASSRPFMTDNLPHLIFDLLNIKSPLFDPRKSPLNQSYSFPKRFIYKTNIEYEP